jgi:hypothetical protein
MILYCCETSDFYARFSFCYVSHNNIIVYLPAFIQSLRINAIQKFEMQPIKPNKTEHEVTKTI